MFTSLIAGATALAFMLSSPIVSWGLKPNTNEQVPSVPPAWQTMLDENDGFYHLKTDDKKVLFTFDLGYEAGYTADVLDILAKHDIKAVFFLCGNYLKESELINRMINEGHTIGNHTNHHKNQTTLSRDSVKKDIMDLQNAFVEKYPDAKPPTLFRPPSGKFNKQSLAVTKENGFITTMWSIAIQDWGKSPIDADACSKKIASRVHPGAVILMHITNAGVPPMVEQLVPLLVEKGYGFADYSLGDFL